MAIRALGTGWEFLLGRSLTRIAACATFTLISGVYSLPTLADPPLSGASQSFADWCQKKATLSPEAKQTVDVLLQHAKTSDCSKATETLSRMTELDLSDRQIRDLHPLSSFTQLTRLSLAKNQISDLTPLQPLTQLTELNLSSNQISDLTPLQVLVNLQKLNVSLNAIADYTPLQYLTKLEVADL